MAVTITPLGLGGATKVIRDATTNGTAENNVNDGAATIYALDVDNTANAAITYVKLYNVATATIGTTDPDIILLLPASVRRTFVFKDAPDFATGLSFAGVTTGGTAGTTSPTSAVITNIIVG